jgi:hypothetical protein
MQTIELSIRYNFGKAVWVELRSCNAKHALNGLGDWIWSFTAHQHKGVLYGVHRIETILVQVHEKW